MSKQVCLCCDKEFEAQDRNRISEFGSKVIETTFEKFGRVGGFVTGVSFAYTHRRPETGPVGLVFSMLVCGGLAAVGGGLIGAAFGRAGDKHRDQHEARVSYICDVCAKNEQAQ